MQHANELWCANVLFGALRISRKSFVAPCMSKIVQNLKKHFTSTNALGVFFLADLLILGASLCRFAVQ